MGVKDFFRLVREKAPSAFKKYDLSLFRGHCVAIDISNVAYRERALALKEVINRTSFRQTSELDHGQVLSRWHSRVLDFLFFFLRHQIIPLVVFDGPPPSTKEEIIAKRREDREAKRQHILALQQELTLLRGDHPDLPMGEGTSLLLKKLREALSHNVEVTHEEMNQLRTIIGHFGFLVYQARFEAEQLCAMLSVENMVTAVFSQDSDTLIHGTHFLLTEIEYTNPPVFYGYELNEILTSFGYTHDMLIEFAILAGCDHNTKLPGIAVGKSYTSIRRYQWIDNIPFKEGTDLTGLNREYCRNIFRRIPVTELIVSHPDLMYEDQPLGQTFGHPSPVASLVAESLQLTPYLEEARRLFALF